MDRYFAFGEGTPTALRRKLRLLIMGFVSPFGDLTASRLRRKLRLLKWVRFRLSAATAVEAQGFHPCNPQGTEFLDFQKGAPPQGAQNH